MRLTNLLTLVCERDCLHSENGFLIHNLCLSKTYVIQINVEYVPLVIHSVIHDLLQTKADDMDVQLKKERQEWASEHNALQLRNAELKVCANLSCRSLFTWRTLQEIVCFVYLY